MKPTIGITTNKQGEIVSTVVVIKNDGKKVYYELPTYDPKMARQLAWNL
jgi:hypothetical protein